MPIKAPTVLLESSPGGGKTFSIASMVQAGIETFVLITEANGLDTLLDAMKYYNLPLDKLHWHVVSPAAPGWDALLTMADTAATKGFEDIQKIKSGVGKEQTRQFTALIKACNNFVCDRTGISYGDVASWDDSRAFVIDSLSGINAIIMAQTIGYKPAAHQGEWGVAMNMQVHFIQKLCSDCQCYFVLLAHVDKELSELTGLTTVTTKALGRKNAPELLKMFSEIVFAKREGKNYYWSTDEFNTDLKQRGLPISSKLNPDFGQIVAIHNARKKAAASPSV